jgi:hypothetical protein
MRRSKSDTIREWANKGLSKSEVVRKTGYSAQLVHSVFKRNKKHVVKAKGLSKKVRIKALVSQFIDDLNKLL